MRIVVLFALVCAVLALGDPVAPAPGTDQERVEFSQLMQKAGKGDAEAQCQVGMLYASGKGVPKDYREAASWYRRSADQGFGQAQVLLGTCYILGQGVPSDLVEAHAWWSLAADKTESAVAARDELEEWMTEAQVASARVRARELRQVRPAQAEASIKP